MIRVAEGHTGAVRFVNCAFWGPCHQIAKVAGKGTVGFSDCTFSQWDAKNEGRHALQVQSGTILIRGCEFQVAKPHIQLGPDVRRAVVSDNVFTGKPQVSNETKFKLNPGVGTE
jgi:hypothetical protein